MDRRQLYTFQTEKIEHAFAASINCGADRVVIVADVSDKNAILFLQHFLTDDQIATLPKQTIDLVPTMIFALENEASFQSIVRRFFPQIADTLTESLTHPEYFVLILSDGDGSLTVHSHPD